MKCRACDEILSDREATRKSCITGEFLDLCDICLKYTDITFTESLYKDELEEIEKTDDSGTP